MKRENESKKEEEGGGIEEQTKGRKRKERAGGNDEENKRKEGKRDKVEIVTYEGRGGGREVKERREKYQNIRNQE